MPNFFSSLGQAKPVGIVNQAIGSLTAVEALKTQRQQQALTDMKVQSMKMDLAAQKKEQAELDKSMPISSFGQAWGEGGVKMLSDWATANGKGTEIGGQRYLTKRETLEFRNFLSSSAEMQEQFAQVKIGKLSSDISAIDEELSKYTKAKLLTNEKAQKEYAALQAQKKKIEQDITNTALSTKEGMKARIAAMGKSPKFTNKITEDGSGNLVNFQIDGNGRVVGKQVIGTAKPAGNSGTGIDMKRTEDGLDAWADKKTQQWLYRDTDGRVRPLAGSGKKLVQAVTPASTILKSKGIFEPTEIEGMAQDINDGKMSFDRALKMMGSREVRGINMRNLYMSMRKVNPNMDVEQITRLLEAGKKNLANLVQLRGQVKGYEGNIDRQLTILETEVLPKLGDSGVKVLNSWWRSGKQAVSGDPTISKAQLLLKEIAAEVARIMSSARGTGQNTAAQVIEGWEEAFDMGLTSGQWQEVIPLVRRNLKGRISALDDVINEAIKNPVSGNSGGGGAGSGWQILPNGFKIRVKK